MGKQEIGRFEKVSLLNRRRTVLRGLLLDFRSPEETVDRQLRQIQTKETQKKSVSKK
jgi:hypothetical protein